MRRVAITGTGTINAAGRNVREFTSSLASGTSGIGRLSLFPGDGYRGGWAAEVTDLEPPPWLDPIARRRTSRSDWLALIAAEEALRQSGWGRDRSSVGVAIGASTGGMLTSEEYCRVSMVDRRAAQVSGVLATPMSSSGDVVAQVAGCYGPRLTVSTACSSGGNALGLGADWIRAGRAPAVLCGGTDALCRMTYSGFSALQALDREPCRPFDRDRAGLTLGEGAAVLLLEDWEHAHRRGAAVLAEFLGYGVTADAHHITQPRPDGVCAAMALERALLESRVSAAEIDYVNAHGTATPANDSTETRVLKLAFGPRAYRLPISSTKSITGHCLAAAGAIEAVVCVIALREGLVPATVHLAQPAADCDLDFVPTASRRQALRTVASNSYGFGGNNTTIVLRHPDA